MSTTKTTPNLTDTARQAAETLKTTVDSLHLQDRVEEFGVAAERAAKRALEEAGHLAHTKREQVVGLLDKAEAALDRRTEGRYAAQAAKVRTQLLAGVDKLAAQRPTATAATPATPASSGTSATSASSATSETPQDVDVTWQQ